MAIICSSLNRLFLTTPPPALAGHRKWRSHIPTGLIFGGQVNQTNNQAIGFSYDANGNLLSDGTNSYTWNQDNHPVSVNNSPATYDAFGNMVENKTDSTALLEELQSPVGNIGIMKKTTVTEYRIPLPGGDTYSVASSNLIWHRDWLGSVRLTSNISNRNYVADMAFAPYGEIYLGFGSTANLNFTGDNQDLITGDFDTPNRELLPTEGRWLSPDPAHASWNAYSYSNNPLGQIDPNGLSLTDWSGNPRWWSFGLQGGGDGNTYEINGMQVSQATFSGALDWGNGNNPEGWAFGTGGHWETNGVESYDYQWVDSTSSADSNGNVTFTVGYPQLIGVTLSDVWVPNSGVLMASNSTAWITAATDAAGIAGLFLKNKVAKPLGRWAAAISILNDPSLKNTATNALGLIEGFDGPIAIIGTFNDFLDWGAYNSTPGPQKVDPYGPQQLQYGLPVENWCAAYGMDDPC